MDKSPLKIQVRTKIQTIPTRYEETENTILVRLEPAEIHAGVETQAKVALLLDNSGSMRGRPQEHVVRALAALAPHFRPADRVAAIAFAKQPQVFHPLSSDHRSLAAFGDINTFFSRVGRASGGTAMADGLRAAAAQLEAGGGAGRIVLLTDGRPNSRQATMKAAEEVAGRGHSLTVMGFGQFDDDFMGEVAALSGGSQWTMADASGAYEEILNQVRIAQDEFAQNIQLEMEFIGKHQILDRSTVHPTVIYHGPIDLGEDRVWRQRLDAVQSSEGLEVLIEVCHPQLSPGRKLVARASLTYDVPALGLKGARTTEDISVVYSDEIQDITAMDSQIIDKERDAMVKRQQVFAERALQAGDSEGAAVLWDTIKRIRPSDKELHRRVDETTKKLRSKSYSKQDARENEMVTGKKRRRPRST